jgi:hypothetical protein
VSRMVRTRFWIETALAALTTVVLLATLAWKEWIEAIFGADPDGGDGSLEWAVVAALLAVSVTLSAMARAEWRRPAPLPAPERP